MRISIILALRSFSLTPFISSTVGGINLKRPSASKPWIYPTPTSANSVTSNQIASSPKFFLTSSKVRVVSDEIHCDLTRKNIQHFPIRTITNYKNIIVTVGRLGTYEKNNSLLLNAIRNLPIELVKKWEFLLIGPSTQEFSKEVALFKEKNPAIANCINMTGEINNRNTLYSYLRRAKIICMTSLSESTCISTLEGMYFGTYPVITNYSDFTLDTTNNNKVGCIVENKNINALVSSLKHIMSDDNLYCKGLESQFYVRSVFDYRVLTKSLDSILRRYIKG